MIVRNIRLRLQKSVRNISSSKTFTVVFIRHGESQWNLENRYTGWHDVDLTANGLNEAKSAGQELAKSGLSFDMVYTSYQKRAIKTAWTILEELNLMWIPVTTSWLLNERHYGALTGLNKQETVDIHGKELVMKWRRSFDFPPPRCDVNHPYYSGKDAKYAPFLGKMTESHCGKIPLSESLKETLQRVVPYWKSHISKDVLAGKKILIAAHGNSLRGLIKHLDGISDDDIPHLTIPTGVPLVYKLNEKLEVCSHENSGGLPQPMAPLRGSYLGDQDAIKKRIEKSK